MTATARSSTTAGSAWGRPNSTFSDMSWGDLNPAPKYLSSEIELEGSADDVMRIDAMSMVMVLNE